MAWTGFGGVGLMVFIVAVMIQVVLEGEVFNSMEKVIQ
jgi:hypothetical protein